MDNLDTHLVKWLGSLSNVICKLLYVYEYTEPKTAELTISTT